MKSGGIGIISGLLAFIGCVIGDIFLVRWLFSLVPDGEWSGLFKVLIVFGDIWLLAGLIIATSILFGVVIGGIVHVFTKD